MSIEPHPVARQVAERIVDSEELKRILAAFPNHWIEITVKVAHGQVVGHPEVAVQRPPKGTSSAVPKCTSGTT